MVTKPKMKTEEVVVSEPLQVVEDIKHVFRVVSFSGAFQQGVGVDAHPANVIEDHLKQSYFNQGYTLYAVEHLRTVVSKTDDIVGEQMLYVLVKYAQ